MDFKLKNRRYPVDNVVVDLTEMSPEKTSDAARLFAGSVGCYSDLTQWAVYLQQRWAANYGPGYSTIVGTEFGTMIDRKPGDYVQMHTDDGGERVYFFLFKGLPSAKA